MKPKPKAIKPTQSSLAKSLGVSRQLIAAHASKPDAPPLGDITGWTAYFAQHGRIGSAPDDLRRAIAQERLEILKETKAKLARDNRIEDGKTMLVASALKQAGEACGHMMAELERRDRELPPALAGLSAVEIGKRMSADTESIRKTLKEKLTTIGE
jgi:hypothetical protein